MHRTNRLREPKQQLLFPVKPHTPYTRAVERLIEKMRRGFLELEDLEKRLIELGIFEEEGEIDLLWAHTIYGTIDDMPQRDHFMNVLWYPVLRALDTLNNKGLRALPHVRRALMRCLIEQNQGRSSH
ncbi:MAG: hypothetical protein ABIG34_00915 [Candidatus Peregrinibacteria bacterium]